MDGFYSILAAIVDGGHFLSKGNVQDTVLAKVNTPYVDISVHFSQSLCDVHLYHFVSFCYFASSFLSLP